VDEHRALELVAGKTTPAVRSKGAIGIRDIAILPAM
jgi:hypothetical protein